MIDSNHHHAKPRNHGCWPCLGLGIALTMLAPDAGRIGAQPLNPAPVATLSTGHVAELLQTLRQAQADVNLRVQAVRALYESGEPGAINQLRIELATSPDPAVSWAILRGLSFSPEPPPAAWVALLVDMLTTADEPLLTELSQTLARYGDPATHAKISAVAVDGRLPMSARLSAISALSAQRNRQVAATLMQLIEPLQPAPVRHAAYAALARITGQRIFGQDYERWRQWWQQQRTVSTEEWNRRLFENLDRQQDQLLAQLRQLELRLVETQRLLYRNSAAEHRPALLAAMLGDAIEAVRLLGMNLCELAVGEAGPAMATPELRSALLAAMDDGLPEMRQRAALLLRDLAEPQAADKAAAVLLLEQEQRPELLRAYLLLLSRLPRPTAIPPAIRLLSRADLRREAAEFLAGAAQNFGLTSMQESAILSSLRQILQDQAAPAPALLELLAEVGQESDWQHLEAWMDHPDPAVMLAAVRAWIGSKRSLTVLMARADRPTIYPLLLEAVNQRGHEPALLNYLVEHRPDDASLRDRWQQALVSMAGRVPGHVAVRSYDRLAAIGETKELRLSFLTSALDPLFPPGEAAHPAADPASPQPLASTTAGWSLAQAQTAGTLLLTRAQVHWEDNQPRSALEDALRIEQHQLQGALTTTQRRTWALLILRAKFALGQLDSTSAYAKLVVEPHPEKIPAANLDELTRLYLETAQRQLPDQPARARTLLATLYELLQGPPSAEHQTPWMELQKTTGPIPAVTPAPNP